MKKRGNANQPLVIRPSSARHASKESSPLGSAALEAEVADPGMRGHFSKYRVCHTHHPARNVVCAGFAERHASECTPIQISERLRALYAHGQDGGNHRERR